MKPTAKVFEYLNMYNYYLPQNLEKVQKNFYEQMIQHLQLADSFKNSFISQIAQINQKAQKEQEFRQLIRDTWLGFVTNTSLANICQMMNQQEMKDVQDFILKVLFEPKTFDISYVDELLSIYEAYFDSNKGVAQVIQRNRFRFIVSKLICSRFIKSIDEKSQLKMRQFLFDIYLKKIDKLDTTMIIQTEFLTEQNFYQKMSELLFDQSDVQGTFFYLIKNVIAIIVRDIKSIDYQLGIFKQFYQLYIDKDKLLMDKWDQRPNIDQNKISNELLQRYKENQNENLKDAIRQVYIKINQTQNLEYKILLQQLVQKDIYNRENEQWVCQILREFDQYQIQKNRRQSIDNDIHTFLRQQGFTLKIGANQQQCEYDSPKFTCIVYDQNSGWNLINKANKQSRKFYQMKDFIHFMHNVQSGFNN